ncbi:MAG: hypothetical protein JWL62_519, partial [Hyphomicrobiales bacterium]|nr:hypothetical protein [Hyphomicrobiales bacterium]
MNTGVEATLEIIRQRFGASAAAVFFEGRKSLWCGDADIVAMSSIGFCATLLERTVASQTDCVAAKPLHVFLDAEPLQDTCGRSVRYFVGQSLPGPQEGLRAALGLFGTSPVAVSLDDARLLADFATVLAALVQSRLESAAQAMLIREQEASLAHSRKVFERSSAAAKIGVWECTLDGENLQWTDGVYDMFEIPRGAEICRKDILLHYAPDSRNELDERRSAAILERSGFTLDAQIDTAKGNRRWIRITATVECEGGAPVRIFGMKQDITEERSLSERTRYLAEFDVLTGLANRSSFQARLADVPNRSAGEAVGLLLVDLDGFKHINDTFGHALGDLCLKEIAVRLLSVCPRADLVARIGGDEFAILMTSSCNDREIENLAAKIVDAVRRPVYWRDHSFQLGASIGIAIRAEDERENCSGLFINADMALYAAKASGKSTFRFFEPSMKNKADRRLTTVTNLTNALTQNELSLYYQPKIRLADARLDGFEALMRWHTPDGELATAGAFAAAFDDPELSRRLGRWVISEALAQAAAWSKAGLDFGHVAINISSSQLQDQNFAERLIEKIAQHDLRHDMIEVEITEGVFLADEMGPAYNQLQRMRSKGIRIAVDDFGTGYASLVHLRSYPVDTIKIDRSFVQHFLTSEADAAILESILSLGLRLGKKV